MKISFALMTEFLGTPLQLCLRQVLALWRREMVFVLRAAPWTHCKAFWDERSCQLEAKGWCVLESHGIGKQNAFKHSDER